MQNKLVKIGTIGFIIVAMAMTVFAIMSFTYKRASASAPSGLPATVATSTLGFVMQTTQTLLAATSTCSARIITTRAQPAMLTFSDKPAVVPTAVTGHLQLASTTVVYDSGQYGCGAVRVVSATPSTDTIDITETQ